MEISSELLDKLSDSDRAELERLLRAHTGVWTPLPGPQSIGYDSDADILGFGGSAGGGKSELGIGLALTRHRRVGFFRHSAPELTAIIDRIADILGSRKGYNGTDRIWRFTREDGAHVQIEFGSFPDPGDERKYQGRPHDLLVFDEAQNMREMAVRFLLGWLRTTDPDQRCRAVLTFNPPTSPEGRWILPFFGPWIDRGHPSPAEPGELRWFATVDGKTVEMDSGEPLRHGDEWIKPLSRTFIPSRLKDNPYLRSTGYEAVLQGLPDTLRRQMLHGDFQAGMEDDAFQVIPSAWVEAAQERWHDKPAKDEMDSIGVDVALGGRDKTVLMRRHGTWLDRPIVYEGRQCVDGPTIASFILAALRDEAVIHLDLFGVGAQPYGHLMSLRQQVMGVNMGEPAHGLDASGRIGFYNVRSMLWWRMREALDPTAREPIALPPETAILADLTAPCWKLTGQRIQVEGRDDLVKKIGRSPDFGTACCLALMDTPKSSKLMAALGGSTRAAHDPYESWQRARRRGGHDPYR